MIISRRNMMGFLCAGAAGGMVTGTVSPARSAGGSPDARTILARSDTIRNPQESFVVDVGLYAYENGKRTDFTQVTTHSRKDDDDGQFLSLVFIDEPARDRSKIVLRNGNLLWFYDPASKASVRLSPRQRLLGNASNGDVVTANFALDYAATLKGEETIKDGDKQMRPTWRLALQSTNEVTPYDKVEFWVDKENYRPLKGEFYTQSGRLLKVAWYRSWQNAMGEMRPTEMVIADGFEPKNVTVMKMSNFRGRELPVSWFNNGWLPRFQKVA